MRPVRGERRIEEVGMVHSRVAGIILAVLAALQACGSYSAPNNSPSSPDSAADTMPRAPGYIHM
jgi:hypothetical protein